MKTTLIFPRVITVLGLLILLTLCVSALRKQKKVRCHPSCCPKARTPKSILGRYMVDIADGSESDGDDMVDLTYVLIKLAKSAYNDFQTPTASPTNGTSYQEYRSQDNMIPNSPISYGMSEAAKRSAVRTRYAPGGGIVKQISAMTGMLFPGSRAPSSFLRGLQPQFNFDRQQFFGLGISSQAAMAVSMFTEIF